MFSVQKNSKDPHYYKKVIVQKSPQTAKRRIIIYYGFVTKVLHGMFTV